MVYLARIVQKKLDFFLAAYFFVEMYGSKKVGLQRINIACPRSVLEEALTRIERAVNSLA
jgi:hypothetical protein